jgi:hypothetical protein
MARLKDRIEDLESAVCDDGFGRGKMTDYWSPKETGAVRRASMDLTRALADLRRND